MADVVRIHPDRVPEADPEPLWREALGRALREHRKERDARLVDIAERAGISTQYLSEIERGRKEPSSEMIAAVTGALGIDLAGLLTSVAAGLAAASPPVRTFGHRVDEKYSRAAEPQLRAA